MLYQHIGQLEKTRNNEREHSLIVAEIQKNPAKNTIQNVLKTPAHNRSWKDSSHNAFGRLFNFSPRNRTLDKKEDPANKIVGGHKRNFTLLDGGRFILKKTNPKECNFYNNMATDPDNPLRSIIPATYVPKNAKNDEIVMENLTHKMNNPLLIDIKIGTRTARKYDYINEGYSQPTAFIRKEGTIVKDALHGLNKRGFTVVGGNTVSGSRLSKARHSHKLLKEFLHNDIFDSHKTDSLLKELFKIREIAKNSNYTFIDSSLFIVLDKAQLKVKLVDFARVYSHKEDTSENNRNFLKYKKRFLYGVDNLISHIKKYTKE